jgi:hypothetical protein
MRRPLARTALTCSSQNLADDPSAHVGESILPALKEIRQPLVIDAQQVQDCRLQVVHMPTALALKL